MVTHGVTVTTPTLGTHQNLPHILHDDDEDDDDDDDDDVDDDDDAHRFDKGGREEDQGEAENSEEQVTN